MTAAAAAFVPVDNNAGRRYDKGHGEERAACHAMSGAHGG